MINLLFSIVQQFLGLVSGGLFYGSISAFLEYYVSVGINEILSDKLAKKLGDGMYIAGIL